MLNEDTINIFLFDSFGMSLLEIGLAIRCRPTLPPNLGSRGICIIEAPLNALPLQDRALCKRRKLDVVVRYCEVERAQSGVAPLVLRGLNYTVDRRLVVSSGQEFHRITSVDNLMIWLSTEGSSALSENTYKSIINVLDESPLSVG